jgi:hypothetical protein
MFTQPRRSWAVALAVAALLTCRPALRAQAPGEPPPVPTENEINPPPPAPPRPGEPPPALEGDVVPQQRGPVHEAFAVPADKAPVAGPAVPRQPPAPVPEVPPEQRPEGDNVIWVPGYWGWDAGRNDYVWVSGCWRVPPPGRNWVPGYWTQTDGRWQWVSGFWAPAGQEELPYLPAPPESLEAGPSTPAPDDDSYYVPGCWLYQDTRYVWRPGRWAPCRPGWAWCPAAYCSTPSGYVFVDGYWDYPLDGRGLLFAPVCFNGTPWTAPGWCYRPSYCIGLGGLLSSLWVGPSRGCYFFGDYFGPRYGGLGFTPWFSHGRGYANPLFGYYRWANRGDPGWYAGLAGAYRGGPGALARSSLVQPLSRLARDPAWRLTHVSPAQFNHHRDFGQRFAAAGRQRQQWEARGAQRQGRPAALPLAHASAAHTSRGRVARPATHGHGTPPHQAGPAHVRPSYSAYGHSPAVAREARPAPHPNHAPAPRALAAQPHGAPRPAGQEHRATPRPSPRVLPPNPNTVQHGPPRHTPAAHPAAAPRPAPAAAHQPAPRPAAARPHPQAAPHAARPAPSRPAPQPAPAAAHRPAAAPRPAPQVARPAPARPAPAPRPAAHVAPSAPRQAAPHPAPHPPAHPAPNNHGGGHH